MPFFFPSGILPGGGFVLKGCLPLHGVGGSDPLRELFAIGGVLDLWAVWGFV